MTELNEEPNNVGSAKQLAALSAKTSGPPTPFPVAGSKAEVLHKEFIISQDNCRSSL